MLQSHFIRGVILGLAIGAAVGLLVGEWVLSPPDATLLASPETQDLRRKLEAATYAKERAERQMEQFQKLAEQMTASFNRLEERFKALEATTRATEAPVATPPGTQ
jgi:hypothetical protein